MDLVWQWIGILGSATGLIAAVVMWRRGQRAVGGAYGVFFLFCLGSAAAEWWEPGTVVQKGLMAVASIAAFIGAIIALRQVEERERRSVT